MDDKMQLDAPSVMKPETSSVAGGAVQDNLNKINTHEYTDNTLLYPINKSLDEPEDELLTDTDRCLLTVTEDEAGMRVDAFTASKITGRTRSFIQKLIKENKVLKNDKLCKASEKIASGDGITVLLEAPKTIDIKAQNIPIEVVYEDASVLVVNKASGMVVHPAHGTPDGTLVNALMHHTKDLSGINGELRPGIVHRIDKDTSGLLVVAKNDKAHQSLAAQLKDHSMTREYTALVKGIIRENKGTIDMPVGRDPNNRKRMAVTDRGSREAVTGFEVLKRYREGYTLCRFRLKTGRTHQIRVHMKQIGHPIAGDPLYGGDKNNKFKTDGQLLHAGKLGFIHPETQEYLEFESQLPPIFVKALKGLHEEAL